MKKFDLLENFVGTINQRITNKRDLLELVMNVLHIEKDPAYRRLCGKVNFSVNEMGTLAEKLNISLDMLMHRKDDYQMVPFTLSYPLQSPSMDVLCDSIDIAINDAKELKPQKHGHILNAVPLEFYTPYPLLCKYMFFKWGYSFIGTEEFNNFSDWKIPDRLLDVDKRYYSSHKTLEDAFYLWDAPIIWTLANDIKLLNKIHIINDHEKEELKDCISELLINLESFLGGNSCNLPDSLYPSVNFYASRVYLGFSYRYISSDARYQAYLSINYAYSKLEYDDEGFKNIKKWIESLLSTSTLLSKSGQLERQIFFKEQYEIIKDVLG